MKPLPPVKPISLARHGIDRDHLSRGQDGDLQELWASGAKPVFEHRGALLVAAGGLFISDLVMVPGQQTEIYLGRDDEGVRYIGVSLDDSGRSQLDTSLATSRARDATDLLTAPGEGIDSAEPVWLPLRQLAESLDDVQVSLACEIVGLGNWHRAHQFSPRTGRPTRPARGGWVRMDPDNGSEHFPRTDPAVIVLIINTDEAGVERVLLGNNAAWEADRYSLLAGFVEPGETLEHAVIREVFEEAHVEVANPQYLGSQPWPFPCSLMLGFSAEAPSLEFAADKAEIATLTWFTREELRAAIERGTVRAPGLVSIAGQLLYSWLDSI
ncbi:MULTISPECIES: NAD(+) diphosphatase [Brevibacterium]|uniref:NAD(+) diphosphatase n=2 Tax=Brevibacterium antiquum TaxID=234835 RepID=A0A2H1KBB6_9MICO|nr:MULTISPECIES: NAD(+) diphosphatase [Brevibacterium]SMX80190.1 NAD+ diphosphatase [Brevibacterium antiquum]SMX97095.1 NAD+ diphosphatase [Brevibacterium antiquum CNRZ 918]HCG56741.1 NAD(+) diphosphatase [Brevibacterium sp.]